MSANISNLFVPSVVAPYIAAELSALNSVVRSGAAVVSSQMNTMLAGGASTFTIPFWKEISASALVPTSDWETKAGVQKVSAGSQVGVRVLRALTPIALTEVEGLMTGADPVGAVAAQLANAHNTIRQSVLLAMLGAVTGVDSGDAGTAADLAYDGTAGVFSASSLIKGVQAVWGDRGSVRGNTLLMTSLTYSTLQLDELNSSVGSRAGIDVGFGTFLGNTVIVDDTVPTGKTYVIRPGGLGFGTASLAVPFEIQRDASAGNGGGGEALFSRDLFSYHVAGTSFTGSFTGEHATDAEIATASKWSLVKDKKFCGVAVIAHA